MSVRIHIYGENKPAIRGFDKEGNYKQWKTAHHGGHRIAESMKEAQEIIQEMLNKAWDVKIEVE